MRLNIQLFNKDEILRNILPTVYFIIAIVSITIGAVLLAFKIIMWSVAILLFVNIFLQNKIVNRIFGIVFLSGSVYMMLAIFDDIIDREVTSSYLVGGFLILLSMVMSALLIWGYKKRTVEF